MLDSLREDTSGATADYIPELANANQDLFAMAVTTATGSIYMAGALPAIFLTLVLPTQMHFARSPMEKPTDSWN